MLQRRWKIKHSKLANNSVFSVSFFSSLACMGSEITFYHLPRWIVLVPFLPSFISPGESRSLSWGIPSSPCPVSLGIGICTSTASVQMCTEAAAPFPSILEHADQFQTLQQEKGHAKSKKPLQYCSGHHSGRKVILFMFLLTEGSWGEVVVLTPY